MKRLLFLAVSIFFTHTVFSGNEETDSLNLPFQMFSPFTFIPDSSKTISKIITQDSIKFVLRDENVHNWDLKIATQQDLKYTRISITPLTCISADTLLGKAIAGLKFSPSGYHFTHPMTVEVNIDNADSKNPIIFFMIDDKGKITDLPYQTRKNNTYSIEVAHFSELVGVVPADLSRICDFSKFGRKVSIDQARKLLTPNPHLLLPPISHEEKCNKTEPLTKKMLNEYIELMMEPEASAITSILMHDRGATLTCEDEMNSMKGFPELVCQLSDQLVKKALNAIETYKNQPDKFYSIARLAIIASSENSRLVCPNSETNRKLIFKALANYLTKNISYYEKKISEEHDFSYINTLINAYTEQFWLMGEEVIPFDQRMAELQKLLHFELEIELKVNRVANEPDYIQKDYTFTKGKTDLFFKLKYTPMPQFDISFNGEGSFTTEGNSFHQGNGETNTCSATPTPFKHKYIVYFNFCSQNGNFTVFSPGCTSKLNWEGATFLGWGQDQMHFTNWFYNELNYYNESKGKIEFKFQNRKEVLIDDVIPASRIYEDGQKVETELHYRIIHKPVLK